MKKKICCKNCGTIIKDDEFSCSICHMKPDRTEEEIKEVEQNSKHLNNNSLVIKIIITVLLIIGTVISFIAVIRIKDMTYCMDSNCSVKNLFMLLIGITLIVSSIITLIKFRNK